VLFPTTTVQVVPLNVPDSDMDDEHALSQVHGWPGTVQLFATTAPVKKATLLH
jgi:hypothetical protein